MALGGYLAPQDCAQLVEALDLAPGQSLLHISCGSGYLSAIAGILLGDHPASVNHGLDMDAVCLFFCPSCLQPHLTNLISLPKNELQMAADNLLILEDTMWKQGLTPSQQYTRPQLAHGGLHSVSSGMAYDRIVCSRAIPSDLCWTLFNALKARLTPAGFAVLVVDTELVRYTKADDNIEVLADGFSDIPPLDMVLYLRTDSSSVVDFGPGGRRLFAALGSGEGAPVEAQIDTSGHACARLRACRDLAAALVASTPLPLALCFEPKPASSSVPVHNSRTSVIYTPTSQVFVWGEGGE